MVFGANQRSDLSVRIRDTVSLMDENKYFPSLQCLLFNISTPYCFNEERHIRRERYGLHLQIVEFGKYFQHDLQSIYKCDIPRFSYVVRSHWKVYKRFLTRWSICRYKLCVRKETLIAKSANISIIKNYLLLYRMLKNSR